MPTITAFDQAGLKVVFVLEKIPDSNTLTLNVTAVNNTLSNMSEFLFQAAVPKVIIFNKIINFKLIFILLYRHSSYKFYHLQEQ